MPTFKDVKVNKLLPPDKPMRTESLYTGLEELKESMALHGLQQPIGVQDQNDGTWKIIWGFRRTLAARELGWKTIPAQVYALTEGDTDMLMAHENFHRTQLDPVEEAEFFRDMMEKHHIGSAEVARRCRRSRTHVTIALDLLAGDPEVLKALREEQINKAQATALNKIKDEIGRRQGLSYATHNGFAARYIDRWREERERTGESTSMEDVAGALQTAGPGSTGQAIKCYIHNDWVDIRDIRMLSLCEACMGGIALMADHYHHCVIAQKEGAEHDPETTERVSGKVSRARG